MIFRRVRPHAAALRRCNASSMRPLLGAGSRRLPQSLDPKKHSSTADMQQIALKHAAVLTRSALLNGTFRMSPEVQDALKSSAPVVALESAIYTHGFPYPDNIALAKDLEATIRENGAVPATIGFLDGVGVIGLTIPEIERLASSAGDEPTMKVSIRDIPIITGHGLAGRKYHGGTTVAATARVAHLAHIRVFATGGLGGVHRGGQDTMDVSADLAALGRIPIAVISSGCKSFLDIPRTLEYLETQGVTVSTFADGRSGPVDFPAFWSRDSGIKSPSVVQNEYEAAHMIYANEAFGFVGPRYGLLFANPIPSEHSIPKEEMNAAIEEAVHEAEAKGFTGHANTPFILAKIKELTKGSSIPANRALILSNAARAAKVAVELHKLGDWSALSRNKVDIPGPRQVVRSVAATTSSPQRSSPSRRSSSSAQIMVVGSVAIDLACDYKPLDDTSEDPVLGTSNPASIGQSIGGVGHNVATAAHLLHGDKVQLASVIADDLAGEHILESMKSRGMDTTGVTVLKSGITVAKSPGSSDKSVVSTAQYVSVNTTTKSLRLAMADMSIYDHAIASKPLSSHCDPGQEGRTHAIVNVLNKVKREVRKAQPKWLALDTNWNTGFIKGICSSARDANPDTRFAFEPVSSAKASRLFAARSRHSNIPGTPLSWTHLCTPNLEELNALGAWVDKSSGPRLQVVDSSDDVVKRNAALSRFSSIMPKEVVDNDIPNKMVQLLPYISSVATKLGKDGVVLAQFLPADSPKLNDPEHAEYIFGSDEFCIKEHHSIDKEPSNENPALRENLLQQCRLALSQENTDDQPSGTQSAKGKIYIRHFPIPVEVPEEEIVSVNGAGDTFLGVLLAGLAKGAELDKPLIDIAQEAAGLTLKSKESVNPNIGKLLGERLKSICPEEK